jgi:nucleotide-binding universal stress UspA family protein
MINILIPTDFSQLADYAYKMAHSLFSDDDIEIHILSIVSVTPNVLFDEQGELLEDGLLDLHSLYEVKQELESKMNKWLEGKDAIASAKVKIGQVTEDILRYIDDNNIDLLIMGTYGASGIKEVLIGSHTSYIAMRSPVPVLSLKSELSKESIKDIVLVGDFRNPQMVDLDFIKVMRLTNNSRLRFLKVNTPGDFETNEEVVARMKEFSEMNELGEVDYHVYCDYSVGKGMASFSEENDIDLIAIGSNQRKGLSRVIKKSVSYEAINHIDKPIISFPVR